MNECSVMHDTAFNKKQLLISVDLNFISALALGWLGLPGLAGYWLNSFDASLPQGKPRLRLLSWILQNVGERRAVASEDLTTGERVARAPQHRRACLRCAGGLRSVQLLRGFLTHPILSPCSGHKCCHAAVCHATPGTHLFRTDFPRVPRCVDRGSPRGHMASESWPWVAVCVGVTVISRQITVSGGVSKS